MARLYVATYGIRATFERIAESKTFRAGVLGFVASIFFCGTLFMLMTPKQHAAVVPVASEPQKQPNATVPGAEPAPGATTEGGHGHALRTFVVLLCWVPLAAAGYVAYSRGYLDRCLECFRHAERTSHDGHRRCTVNMDVEMTSQNKDQLRQLFDSQGRLCPTLVQDRDDMAEFSNRTGTNRASSASSVRGFDIRVADQDAAGNDGKGEDDEADESKRSTRKKKTQRHNFNTQVQDQDKAQAAAKARLQRRTQEQAEKTGETEGQVEEAAEVRKVNVNVKVGDGIVLGLKLGPGLVVTGIQADSAVSEWNASHPDELVVEGAKVISINGTTAPTDMLKLTRSKETPIFDIWFQLPGSNS